MSAQTDKADSNSGNAAVSGGEQGAAMGSAAGPYGALIGGLFGAGAGLINSNRDIPSLDLAQLFSTIAASGQNERQLINSLPENLRPLYDQYKADLAATGQTLQTTNNDIGQTLTDKTAALYDPNGGAVQATLAALKQQDYSTIPGTLASLKANLAATGGLSRGGAGRAITQAVLAPAAQYSQQAATVQGQQLTAQQQANQAAINKVAALDESTAQSLFGMSKEQATTILTSGRQDLQAQLASLINQSRNETGQALAVQGVQANNGYQEAVANNANQAAITNGLMSTGASVVNALAAPGTPPPPNGAPAATTPNYADNPTVYGLQNA